MRGGGRLCQCQRASLQRDWVAHTEWSTARRQVREADLKGDTDAIGVCDSVNTPLDIPTRIIGVEEFDLGKCGYVDNSWRVVLDDSCISKRASDGV